MILPLENDTPKLGHDVFVAPSAWVIGQVTLGDRSSVFFNAVLRGDILRIDVGEETNIQEHALLHTTTGRTPTIVGARVTIGHRAIVHGCSVGEGSLIGMGAIVLDQAEIGSECLIGAGALIPEGKVIPKQSLVLGVPGKVVRTLTAEEVTSLYDSARHYVETAARYRNVDFGEQSNALRSR